MEDHVFEIVILEVPTENQRADGKQSRIVSGPIVCVAADSQAACLNAVMGCKEKFDRDRMKVLVRSF